jgi:segregation and condensation protein A
MENPTFHLDAVVRTREAMEDFDGPLSLILQLLAKNKVEIKDIKIAVILEQYLDYLAQMERMDLEIASEFISMASQLMYIKVKTLLKGTEEIEEMDSLISSLEEAKRKEQLEKIKAAVIMLQTLAERGEGIFVRAQEPLPEASKQDYTYKHEVRELTAALYDIFGRDREKAEAPSKVAMPTRLSYPIGEKSDEIMLLLRDRGPVSLKNIFIMSRNRSELTAYFMAVLELYRSERIGLDEGGDGLIIRLYNL